MNKTIYKYYVLDIMITGRISDSARIRSFFSSEHVQPIKFLSILSREHLNWTNSEHAPKFVRSRVNVD